MSKSEAERLHILEPVYRRAKKIKEMEEENEQLRFALDSIRGLVDDQAEDPGLSFLARTGSEEYVMRALKLLHARIKSHTKRSSKG